MDGNKTPIVSKELALMAAMFPQIFLGAIMKGMREIENELLARAAILATQAPPDFLVTEQHLFAAAEGLLSQEAAGLFKVGFKSRIQGR